MKKIILVGGGGHCKAVIDVLEQQNKYEIIGIIDKLEKVGSKIFNYEVIADDAKLNILVKDYPYAFITIGHIKSPSLRIKLFNLVKESGFLLPTIVSPRAHVSKYSSIGEGTIIMHDAIINANSIIGNNCIINSKALIEHDTIVSDHCHISTNATINGGVTIGSNCFIGSNVTTNNNIKISDNSFIKAGSLVK